ncbi:hypothetical protein EON79_05890 [bacterium]|nr:MAG: hypothetical protein EON79_05890 [bacterium]
MINSPCYNWHSVDERPVRWMGSSLDDLKEFPREVMQSMGHALDDAQRGGKSHHAKPLVGFGGAGVLEVVENHDGDTYRAVYTVKFEEAIYVLHAFQKKSRSGIKTSQGDLQKIERRLREARELHEEWRKHQDERG